MTPPPVDPNALVAAIREARAKPVWWNYLIGEDIDALCDLVESTGRERDEAYKLIEYDTSAILKLTAERDVLTKDAEKGQ